MSARNYPGNRDQSAIFGTGKVFSKKIMTHNGGSPQDLKRALLTMKTFAQIRRTGIPGMIKRDGQQTGLVRPRQADKRTEGKCGDFPTKRVILEIYDEMAEAIRTSKP